MADLIDRELDAVARDNAHLKAKVEGEADASAHTQWLAHSLRDPSAVVRSFPNEAYAVPSAFRRMLPRALCDELGALLDEVRRLNEACVGLRVGESDELLTDADSEALRAGLRDIYRRVVEHRLSRRNPRDDHDLFARFDRIYNELLPPVDAVLNRFPSAHAGLMLDAHDFLAWHLYTRTWRPMVRRHDRHDGLIETEFVLPLRHRARARWFLELYNWHQYDDLRWLTTDVDCSGLTATHGAADPIGRLEGMAADLLAMRPFLMPGFDPARTMTQVGPRLWAAWSWKTGTRVGQILLARDERSLLDGIQSRFIHRIVYVGHEGELASAFTPWLGTGDVRPTERALAGNLALLTPLYERVFALYGEVDIDGILARFRPDEPPDGSADQATDPEAEAQGQEAVLGALAQARPEPEEDEPSSPVDLSRRVRGIRFNRFARAVERLGCEIRQGKGSEVLVYRPGHTIARLGHHARNPELSPGAIRAALRRLGLTLAEFVGAY